MVNSVPIFKILIINYLNLQLKNGVFGIGTHCVLKRYISLR